MVYLNKVFLMGNLTRDPELRYTTSGTAVASFGIAVNRRYKDQSGELQEEVCFIDVTVWDKLAEVCNDYLRKGRPVPIEGRLHQQSWEKDGQNRSKLEVVALNVQFLGTSRQDKEEIEDITEDDLPF